MKRTFAHARTAAVTSGLIGLLALGGCAKREGARCTGTQSICANKTEALSCRDGTFQRVACRGPLACNDYQDHANCDDSVAEAGDACMTDRDEHFACSSDTKRAVVCKGGRYERWQECRGKLGCSLLGERVSCDVSVARPGDPCKAPGSMACDEDHAHLLECRDGAFAVRRNCRGRFGCTLKDDVPACDETISLEGDPCGIAGYMACSVDAKSELSCQGGRFVKTRSCKGICTVTSRSGRAIECP